MLTIEVYVPYKLGYYRYKVLYDLILSFTMAPPLGFGQVITTSFMENAMIWR